MKRHQLKPRAPADLLPEAEKFWQDVNEQFDVEDVAAQQLLLIACKAMTEMLAAQALVRKHGILVRDRFGQLVRNPATTVERDARHAMLGALKQLNLDIGGQPPGTAAWKKGAKR